MEEQQMAMLTSRRTTMLAALGRAEAFGAGYEHERDQMQVQLRLDHLDDTWASLEEVQVQLEDHADGEEGRAEHASIRADYETRFFLIKALLLSKLRLISDTRNPQFPHANSTLSGIKLPTISLPEFDGDYQQWLAFHDTFLALIHTNTDVPAIQKFHYLRAAIKGEAAQLIESIAISSANYLVAWEALVNRYSNDYLLKKRHLQALFDTPPMKKESASALHALVDEFERHTKVLQQLGEPTEAWSTILEHLLCTRLHSDTLKAWEDHASTVADPNYTCLIEFLQRRTRVLESISVNQHSSSAGSATSSHQPQQSRRSQSFRLSSYASTSSSGERCAACNQSHFLTKCVKFGQLSVSDRQQLVSSKRLCHNCLGRDHMVRNCASKYNCRHCNRRHHTLLHSGQADSLQRSTSDNRSAAPSQPNNQPKVSTSVVTSEQAVVAATEVIPKVEVSAALQQPRENVFLLTVLVKVVDSLGMEHIARALLDSASQPNLITDRMARILRLKRSSTNVMIQGAGQLSKAVRHSVSTEVKSRKSNFSCGVNFLVMDKLTAELPSQNVATSGWNIPADLFLADPAFNERQPIDMVLGAKHFYSFFPSAARIQLDKNLPLLVDSVFGWIVTGSTNQVPLLEGQPTSHSYTVVSMLSLEDSLERFWKTEELTMNDNYSVEERDCQTLFQSTTLRTPEGRYVVRYPRKQGFDNMLGDSKASALRRFHLLERRLERDLRLKEEYNKFMQEYIILGHMRLVEPSREDYSKAYYLPHHPVFKESSTTTKVRVVFDGSAATSTGFSLNQALCVGPVVQEDLMSLLLRFRTYPVALVADAAKMYRQVLVHPEDQPLQRIFWRFSQQTPVQIYELQTVTYGLAPSAFLATRTLQQLAKDEGQVYPLGSPALQNNFYVDDFIGGAQSVEEATRLRAELSELLGKGGFELRKWTSNRLEVLQGLDEGQIGTQSSVEFSPSEMVKALGIGWEPEADCLRFDSQIQRSDEHPTKQSILSAIAKLFDPLGHIAPVVVTGKILMQQLWLLACEWYDPVPEAIRIKWEKIHQELSGILSYRIDRYAFLPNSIIQLHVFVDASKDAYGSCCYARCENSRGQVKIVLLAAKSRVSPLKRLSITRLELNGAVLGVHLLYRIKQALKVEVSETYFWTDSAVVLQWIKAPPNVWPTYVANRVSEIQYYSRGCRWNHVGTADNPADLVSRGMSVPDFLDSEMWKQGPQWLKLPQQQWPRSNPPGVPDEILEIRTVAVVSQPAPAIHPWFLRWSSYSRMLHVIGYCQRFVTNMREKARTSSGNNGSTTLTLTVEQLAKAKTLLTRLAQQDSFSSELKELERGRPPAKHSNIRLMSPFVDAEGVLRVGGRLKLSQLPYQAKHPALLSGSHPFARLLAEYYHRKLLHGGGRLLLTAMREEFWPTNGRRLASSIVRNCFRCVRLNPEPIQQQIGQLPAQRVTPSRPFSVTGVDYAGPLYLKPIHKRAAPAKAYICIFVCFTTKAVHIELVSDLSTPAFIAALRRFIARRGVPSHIHSDNGKNFEGAKNELARLYTMLRDQGEQQSIRSFCVEEGITWHLTPPKAPHFGGLWEAAVKVAKKHLFRQLGPSRLSFEDMSTVLTQIEALMNSRPLLPLSEDPNDLSALTPAHFLIGTTMHALPDPDLRHIPANRLEHYQQLQLYTQQFWNHWRREYLQELLKDTKGYAKNDEIQPGRMVIVVDEMQGPIRWPLARIEAVHPGVDNITRVVSLRTASSGIITRPTTKICLLPLPAESSGAADGSSEAIHP